MCVFIIYRYWIVTVEMQIGGDVDLHESQSYMNNKSKKPNWFIGIFNSFEDKFM